MKRISLILSGLIAAICALAEPLQPGFDIAEYRECISMASHWKKQALDSVYFTTAPKEFQRVYSSPEVGFDNLWELWERADSVIAVSIRGSVMTATSWISNFHAGMVPASGEYYLGEQMSYSLCDDSLAHVHVGWLGGMLALRQTIEAKLDSCYKTGHRNVILTGHSQGGAICFLLTAYLRHRQALGELPADIVFKTYCSAAPKPGDYNFALEYEYMTRGGWAYNVVNADDWVPEVPLSVQQLTDFRPTNPFDQIDTLLADAKAIDRMKVKLLFNQVNNPIEKSEKRLRKYLGKTLGGMLQDEVPEYQIPTLSETSNYARCGQTIVLRPDAEYHKNHPQRSNDAFEHHMFKSYGELADKYTE